MRRLALLGLGLAACWPSPGYADNPAATVTVDAVRDPHPISPLIYGVAWASAADLSQLNATINRGGGTPASTYSWKYNAENLSDDWYFESYPQDGGSTGGALYDRLILSSSNAGAAPMVTIPLIGWVAKLGTGRAILPSFSVKKYGAQCSTDQYLPDAGDGLKPDCTTKLTGNKPTDAYVADSLATEQGWVQHLLTKWKGAANGGLAYYIMDNESSIWFGDHWDVHPVGPHATEISNDVINYSAMIKSIDPKALVVAPEEYGWFGYYYSGFDQQWLAANNFDTSHAPDRTGVMGKMDYLPWLLKQWKAAGHPVDVVSLHFYPLGGEFSDDNSTATQILRNKSTRQFWDAAYSPPYYPNTPVKLIPRLRAWVNTYYQAGTPIAITEYNWGGEAFINGATAQADIEGIFGREGLDMATRWTVPPAGSPTYKAMQMYRNYDGHHSAFGDVGVHTTSPSPDDLSAFGAVRSLDGALTVMVINKDLTGNTPVTVRIANFALTGVAHAYQLTAAKGIASLPDLSVKGKALSLAVPPQSITLLVLPAEGRTTPAPPTAVAKGVPTQTYAPAPPTSFTYSITLNGRSSQAGAAAIVRYLWSFGDGTDAVGPSLRHSYANYGIYPAMLTVTDANGLSGTTTYNVAVEPQPQAGVTCTAHYEVTATYDDGSFLGDVLIKNTSKQNVGDWVVTWNWPGPQTLINLWNANGTQSGNTVAAVSYGDGMPAGKTGNPSFYAQSNGSNPAPSNFMLNGTACTLN